MANINSCDYAVYSTDYTEAGHPLVGHGMFSWLHLASESRPSEDATKELKFVIGRVCTNMLALFSGASKETLEINLRLKPITNCTQAQYLRSIQLYKNLASFLPPDFDHPSWAAFLSQNPNLSAFLQEFPASDESNQLPNAFTEPTDARKRHKSSSPPLPATEITYNNEQFNAPFPPQYLSSSSPPLTSASLMSNLDSDMLTTYSSPQPPFDMSMAANTPAFATPSIRAIKSGWNEAPTSPITMSSPINGDRDYARPIVKRSLSTSTKLRADQIEQIKVVARGSKTRQRDRVIKGLYEAVAAGEVPPYCQNCGTINPSTWRKTRIENGGEEKEYMLCNPCGLWYTAKKTMRPPQYWANGADKPLQVPSPAEEMTPNPNPKPKEKVSRRRRGPNKQPEDYSGPSIAMLLAQNVRPKLTTTATIVETKEETNEQNETAEPAIAESEAMSDSKDDPMDNAQMSSGSAGNTPDETGTDSGEGKKKQIIKDKAGTRVSKKTKERKPRTKKLKNPLVSKGEPVPIAPAPGPGRMDEEHSSLSKLADTKTLNASSAENEGTQPEKIELLVEDKENHAPAKSPILTGPASPTFTTDQLNFSIVTPQKARRTDSAGGSQTDDFGFFDGATFSGSPSRWISKLLSSGGKSTMDLGFGSLGEMTDDALRTMLISPTKGSKNDVFESLARDLGIDHGTPTDFAKLMEPLKDCKSATASPPGSASKKKSTGLLSESPAIERKVDAKTLTKSMTLPSSPPQQFYRGEAEENSGTNASDEPVDIWSDAPSPMHDEALTVKISPEPSKD